MLSNKHEALPFLHAHDTRHIHNLRGGIQKGLKVHMIHTCGNINRMHQCMMRWVRNSCQEKEEIAE